MVELERRLAGRRPLACGDRLANLRATVIADDTVHLPEVHV